MVKPLHIEYKKTQCSSNLELSKRGVGITGKLQRLEWAEENPVKWL